MDQLTISDHGATVRSPYVQQRSLDQRFEEFHTRHPEVYERLVELTRRAHANGYRVAIATVYEVARWSFGMRGVKDDAGFRLNNDYRSRYARRIMETETDLEGAFNLRTLTA